MKKGQFWVNQIWIYVCIIMILVNAYLYKNLNETIFLGFAIISMFLGIFFVIVNLGIAFSKKEVKK